MNNSGFPLASSIAAIKDIKTPTTPVVTDDGVYTAVKGNLRARWTSTIEEGSIGECRYAIGTTAGGTNLINWTSAGTSMEINRIDLTLQNVVTYYIAVQARNSLGNYWSDIGVSDGIVTDFIKPNFTKAPEIIKIFNKSGSSEFFVGNLACF